MNPEKVDFTEISEKGVTWTLLATLYLRAYEYRHQTSPILGDRHAAEAVDRIEFDFDRLKRKLRPESNQFLVALRARRLDHWSRDFLAAHPDACVLHLGCGLDSRMLRLDPDAKLHWFDVDIPEVIEARRRLYAEHGRYRMIGSSVTDEGWLDTVPADRPVLVVAEGLLPFLPADAVRGLMRRLTGRFGSGELIFDAMAPWAVRLHPLLQWSPGNGRSIEHWNPRLKLTEAVSFGMDHRLIPSRRHRALYRFMISVPGLRNTSRLFRFTFS